MFIDRKSPCNDEGLARLGLSKGTWECKECADGTLRTCGASRVIVDPAQVTAIWWLGPTQQIPAVANLSSSPYCRAAAGALYVMREPPHGMANMIGRRRECCFWTALDFEKCGNHEYCCSCVWLLTRCFKGNWSQQTPNTCRYECK